MCGPFYLPIGRAIFFEQKHRSQLCMDEMFEKCLTPKKN